MSARDAILARIDRASATGRIPDTSVRASLSLDSPQNALERLVRELTALGVDVSTHASDADVRARVAAHVNGRRALAWTAERLPYGVASVVADAIPYDAPYLEQAAAEIGVTGCDAAIAETGSLVLLSGRGAPRTTSLLPPVHLAIVRRADIVFTAAEFFSKAADRITATACGTLITGPSRTADIELSLTIGVHGPGRLVVVVGP